MVTQIELLSARCQACGHARELAADECIGANQLPRRMTDDEVRFPDGSAGRMRYVSHYLTPWVEIERIDADRKAHSAATWSPGYMEEQLQKDHPAKQNGQLARLQSFWDKNQPKEDLQLSWFNDDGMGKKAVRFTVNGATHFYYGSAFGWHTEEVTSPSQRATVEAFFAKGPPVELAEDECESVAWRGDRFKMRVVTDGLELTQVTGLTKGWRAVFHPGTLKDTAAKHPDPLGWPRALAYFDRHVGKPEPARVTDVRYDGGAVQFTYMGLPFAYAGTWHLKQLHPQDIALIERCWAEGRKEHAAPVCGECRRPL